MATRKTAVPDAWDDDWEKVADVSTSSCSGKRHRISYTLFQSGTINHVANE